MSRRYNVFAIIDGRITNITKSAGWATKQTIHFGGPRDAIRVNGCGFDGGWEIVYSLAWSLWPDGFGCIGQGCQSNEHSNGDRDYTPHMDEKERIGADGNLCTCHGTHWHKTPGYALRHESL